MKIRILTLKNLIKTALVLLLLFAFTAFPGVCIRGAQNGFKTAAYSVLPSILPFMILSKYIINISNSNKFIDKLAQFFNVPSAGMYAILLGSLAGYPVGASLLTDQIKKKE